MSQEVQCPQCGEWHPITVVQRKYKTKVGREVVIGEREATCPKTGRSAWEGTVFGCCNVRQSTEAVQPNEGEKSESEKTSGSEGADRI